MPKRDALLATLVTLIVLGWITVWCAMVSAQKNPWVPEDGIPNEVMRMTIGNRITLARAWREYLGLTQDDVARRLGISQPALAQMENAKKPRKATLEKLALALGIRVEQL